MSKLYIKSIILFFFLININNSFAQDNCSFSWNLSFASFDLGKSFDTIELINQDNIRITSIYKPTDFVKKIFNKTSVKREVIFSKEKNSIISRKEFSDNQLISNWKNLDNNFTLNDNLKFSLDDYEVIDSTIFPYLMILKNNNKNDVLVINNNSFYKTSLNFKENNILFKSDKAFGEVKLNNKEPVEWQFTNSGKKVTAKLIQKTCK